LNKIDMYIQAYEKYLNVVPNSSWAATNLGRALLHDKQYKRAVLWLSKACRLDPKGSLAEDLLRARQALTKSRGKIDTRKAEVRRQI
jgi:hypothetical protein